MSISRPLRNKVIIPFNPEVRLAVEHLRQIAKGQTGKIFWKEHAKLQMHDRGIIMRDALRVLEFGQPIITHEGIRNGEIEIKMAFKPSGMREIAVVTALISPKAIARIITVMWRDEYANF